MYNIFHQSLNALDKALPKMKFPKTEQECSREAENFVKLSMVPIKSFVASFDGIEVAIKQPPKGDTKDCRSTSTERNFFDLFSSSVFS